MMKKVKTGNNTYSYQKFAPAGFNSRLIYGKLSRFIHDVSIYNPKSGNAVGGIFFDKLITRKLFKEDGLVWQVN
jgi:hypothetical protein